MIVRIRFATLPLLGQAHHALWVRMRRHQAGHHRLSGRHCRATGLWQRLSRHQRARKIRCSSLGKHLEYEHFEADLKKVRIMLIQTRIQASSDSSKLANGTELSN